MQRRNLILIAIGLLATGSSTVSAQALPDSMLDQRIRIHFARQERSLEGNAPRQALRGVLTRVSEDSITIRFHPSASPVTVSVNGVQQIDLSRGVSRSRSAVKQALLGAVYMGALGTLSDHEFGGGSTQNALIWAGGGLIIGAIMGSVLPEESWKRVFRR